MKDARSLPPLVAAAAALTILAGCGGGNTTVVTQPPSSTSTTSSTASTVTATTTQSPTGTTTSVATSQPPVTQAESIVSQKGYDALDSNDYRQHAPVAVLVGVKHGSGDGTAQRAFFFAGGRYIGTDTSDDSAGIRVADQSDSTVTLEYALYDAHDAQCCPSGQADVGYHWDGSSLQPLDPIPPSSFSVNGSRR